MATIRFYTRSKIDKLVPVYIRYQDGRSINIRLITPFKIFPSYWSEKKQRLTDNILFSQEFTRDQAMDIQDKFSQLRDAILRESFKLTAPASTKWLKDVIDRFYYKDARSHETLIEYIQRFIAEAKSGKRLTGSTKKKYTIGSCRVLIGFKQAFERFCNETGKQYDFDDINMDFYNDFVKFYYDRNCSGNYVGRLIKHLKTIMRASREEGLHTNLQTDSRAFKVIRMDVDSIYLTTNEIQKLYDMDLSMNKPYEIARDVFLIGVYTAQRYSDYSKITKNNIRMYGDAKVIELHQQKTGEKCIIPIRPECEAILKKYDYTLPRTYEQKLNEFIREIAKAAKINEIIQYEQNRGGLTVKKKAYKYQQIRSHTARRTGCTLMHLAGINTLDIMKISGHRTEREFLKYIRLGKEETAISLANHPYFKGNVLKVVK